VRATMLDVLRFWIDRGVDGFRVDATRQLLKDPEWRDNPPNPDWDGVKEYDSLLPIHSADLDEVQDVVAAMRRVIGERLMVAEVYAPIERLVRYYGKNGNGAQLPFNFHLLTTPWDAEAIAALVERYEAALPPGAWPNWVLGNHDRPRVASRVGVAQARVAEHAKTDPVMTSEVLRTLQRKGLVERRPHPEDTRAKSLKLTPEGTRIVRRAVGLVERTDLEFFAPLDGDAEALTRLLRRLTGAA